MKHILILLAILVLSLILTSCDNITDQEDLAPGSRNYTWTVDTVFQDIVQNEHAGLSRIWGSSANNIWYLSQINKELRRSDGKNWSLVQFPQYFFPAHVCILGNISFMLLSNDNTYCIYNGTSFGEIKQIISSEGYISINDVYAYSASDVYAVGSKYYNGYYTAVILHYNGSQWNLKETEYMGSFNEIAKGANSGLLISYSSSDIYMSTLLEYNGTEFKKIVNNEYSFVMLGANVYLSSASSLYKYKEGKVYSWKRIGSSFYPIIFGRSESDFFFQHSYGIGHFNGKDERVIYPNGYIRILDALIKNTEIYFLVYNYDSYQVQVIRGVQM